MRAPWQGDEPLQYLLVQARQVERNRHGAAQGVAGLPWCGNVVGEYPVPGVGFAWAFVGGDGLRVAVEAEFKNDGVRYGVVHAAQHIAVERWCLELDGENLYLQHAWLGGKVDGFRGQFVLPDDLLCSQIDTQASNA